MEYRKSYNYGDIVFITEGECNTFLIVSTSRTMTDVMSSYQKRFILYSLDNVRRTEVYYEPYKVKRCISNDFKHGRNVIFKNGETGTVLNKTIEVIKENGTKKQIRLSNYNNALVNLKDDNYTIESIYYITHNSKDGRWVEEKVFKWNRKESMDLIKSRIEKLKNSINVGVKK